MGRARGCARAVPLLVATSVTRVYFSCRGGGYPIDLRPTNVDKFNAAFEPFVKVAEKVGKARRGSKADVTAKDTGSGRSKEQLQAVRDWAVKNGYDVALRGGSKRRSSTLCTDSIRLIRHDIQS
ncbi:Lsr2 dimerization domain-containing protein [Rhodococcus qingshengii]|uniref:Lsr2 dimerization domain-containing protein n=1 Tax=Rhodococcus qingshengii TaxID=334542 RepID=UPI001ABF6372|nr:histone-like nucleoid-structuring protein Lsr2 [Rhodococcus qingshengii]